MSGMREDITINRDWKFRYDAEPDLREEWAHARHDDRDWQGVALPHTWSTYETTGHPHPFMRDAAETDDPAWWHGWGWYRKRFFIGENMRGLWPALEFDGVQKYCRVYLNGRFAGEHRGGFTSFSIHPREFLEFGAENLLAVAVSNRRDDTAGGIPPMMAGNWNVYGGIYRDVRLALRHPVHIPYQGNWEHDGGTFITTPEVSAECATVNVKTWLRNTLGHAVRAKVSHSLRDPDGRETGRMETGLDLPADAILPCETRSGRISRPRLWSPETPALYRVLTTVEIDGITADTRADTFGFRWFEWDYERRRLVLNGRPVHIHGTNRHQEYPWLGDAVPKWLHERDLTDIRRGLGHNFLRTCHYPQDPAVYDLSDRLGLIVCEEVPNIKDIPFDPVTQRRNVIEMIRRDRNHPSILMWSMGNETNCAADGAWARAEDTSRIIHFRKVRGRGGDEPHDSGQIDMENLLRCSIRGWTRDDDGPENGQASGSEVWQHGRACVDNGSVRGRIDRNNMVVWLYADHGADREYRDCPLKHVNPKGLVDAYRMPKYLYHLYRAHFGAEPVAFIHPRFWRARFLGQKHAIRVDSNATEVELLVNGRPVGRAMPGPANFYSVVFPEITVEPGTLTAVARRGGQTVEETLALDSGAERLTLRALHDRIPADRSGITLVEVAAVDALDRPVRHAHPTLRWEIEGPGRLLGPPLWQSELEFREADEGTMYTLLPTAMPVRAGSRPGIITVRVSADGLEPARTRIRAFPPERTGPPERDWLEPPVDDGRLTRPAPRANRTRRRAIPIIYTDLHWPPDDRGGYWRKLDAAIRNAGVTINITDRRYQSMLDTLADMLVHHDGVLIADDYNFAVERFNAGNTDA